MFWGKNCVDHAVIKLQNETDMEPITTNANFAARSEFIGANPANVLRCGIWANVASYLIKKIATSRGNKYKLFLLTLLSSDMGKCK